MSEKNTEQAENIGTLTIIVKAEKNGIIIIKHVANLSSFQVISILEMAKIETIEDIKKTKIEVK